MSDLVPIPKRGAPDSPHLSRDIPSAFVPISQLLPYARNARTHSDAQVAQIAASIVEWGWTNPILADAKGIVAGHGRLAAARLLYGQGRVLHLPSGEDVPAGCVPCIDVSGWSDTARRAYVLADNQLALQAGWDDAMLAEELRAIRDDGFDIDLTGFDDAEVGYLLASAADDDGIEPAEIDHSKATKLVALGDIWQLGPHRILCGDSNDDAAVARLMDGATAQLHVVDPPYEIEQDAWLRWVKDPSIVFGIGKHLRLIPLDLYRFERVIVKKHHNRKVGTQIAILHAFVVQVGSEKVCPDSEETFLSVVRQYDVTDDDTILAGYGNAGAGLQAYGQKMNRYRKPHSLLVEHMSQWCPPWRVVFDPFLGSGSTLFAAHTLGRACYGVELNPRVCDAIVDLWLRTTGVAPHKVES
jgi:hypothetical protein